MTKTKVPNTLLYKLSKKRVAYLISILGVFLSVFLMISFLVLDPSFIEIIKKNDDFKEVKCDVVSKS